MLSSKAKVYQCLGSGSWYAMGELNGKPTVYEFIIESDEWIVSTFDPVRFENGIKSGIFADIGERAGAL